MMFSLRLAVRSVVFAVGAGVAGSSLVAACQMALQHVSKADVVAILHAGMLATTIMTPIVYAVECEEAASPDLAAHSDSC